MKHFLTICLGKFVKVVLQIFGSGGSALPGLIMSKFDPGFLDYAMAKVVHGSIVITGTNGKTTTAGLLTEILERNGYEVMTNKTGSNLYRGLLSEMLDYVDWRGNMMADIAVLEIDEADLINLAKRLHLKALVVTNLFRDQLDRYGELDNLRRLISQAVKEMGAGSKLFLNADDPLVYSLAREALDDIEKVFFGMNCEIDHDPDETAIDVEKCMMCGAGLKYKQKYVAHLGDYKCEKCNFVRPRMNVWAKRVSMMGVSGLEMTVVNEENIELELRSTLPGFYNAYNILAAVTVAVSLGVENDLIMESVQKFVAVFGRFEKVVSSNGNVIYLLLSKNPTGFNQLIKTLNNEKESLSLIFLLNDNYADGRDISWIWDVDFEKLEGRVSWVALGGTRAAEMAVRLKYAEIGHDKIVVVDDLNILLNDLLAMKSNKPVFVLATYTGMLQFRELLNKKGLVKKFWVK